MHPPPRRSVDVLPTRYFDLVGQSDDHGVVIRVGSVSDDNTRRCCHRDWRVVAVRSKLAWYGDDHLVSGTVTLFEGQGDGELNRLIGRVLWGPI